MKPFLHQRLGTSIFEVFSVNFLFDNCIRVYGTLSPQQFYVLSKGTMAVAKLQDFSVTAFISIQEIMTDRQTDSDRMTEH